MVNRPTEQEQVDIIVKNLLPVYQTHLLTQCLPDFRALVATVSKIEDCLQNGQIKDESSNLRYKRGGYTHQPNNFSSSMNQKVGEITVIGA